MGTITITEMAQSSSMLALLLPVFAAILVGADQQSVSTLDADADARKVVVQIWSHSKGGPRGSPIELHIPGGQAADVAELVATKKVERAKAELQHSKVKETQAKQINDELQSVRMNTATRARLTQKQYKRASSEKEKAQKVLDAAQVKDAATLATAMEKKQTAQFASAKKKPGELGLAKVAETQHAASKVALKQATAKFQKADSKLRSITPEHNKAQDKANAASQKAVAAGVRLRAATEERERNQYLKVKSQHVQKLSVSKQKKEKWRIKLKHSRNNLKGAQEMFALMDSAEGKASAKKSITKAKKNEKKAYGEFEKSRKNVEKVTAALQKNEEDYAKKAAFKSYLTAARASAVAADADKAFTTTLDKADKKAKDAAAQEAHRILQKDDEKSRANMANLETVKLIGKQEKDALADEMKKRKAEQKKKLTDLKAQKKDAKMTKQALKGFGKAPPNKTE